MKKELLFAALASVSLLLAGCNANPQQTETAAPDASDTATETAAPAPTPTDSVYEVAEVMPEFPGGTQALFKFISENLEYPQIFKSFAASTSFSTRPLSTWCVPSLPGNRACRTASR